MAYEIRKTVSVIQDFFDWLRTSRPAQSSLIIGVIVLVVALIIGLFYWIYIQQKENHAANRPQPTEIHFESLDDLIFVNAKTGKSQVWFAKTDEGYVLYNGEGYSSDGTELKAAKGEEIQNIKTWAQQQIASRHVAEIQSLFLFDRIPPNATAVVVAIQSDSLPAKIQEVLASQITTALKAKFPGRVFVSDVVAPRFFSQGYFDQAFSRDANFLNEISFFKKVKALLLIRPTLSIKDTSSVEGMNSAQIRLEFRSFESDTTSTNTATCQAAGAGFSVDTGLRNAIDTLFRVNDGDIKKLFSGDL